VQGLVLDRNGGDARRAASIGISAAAATATGGARLGPATGAVTGAGAARAAAPGRRAPEPTQ
jgi:hypothetical protein